MSHHLRLEFGSADLVGLGVYNCWASQLGLTESEGWGEVKAAYTTKLKALPDTAQDEIVTLVLALDDYKSDQAQDVREDLLTG